MEQVDVALDALRKGLFVLVYDADGREEEVDFTMASCFVEPKHIREMRTMGGGLICTTLLAEDADSIGLPYMVDVLEHAAKENPLLHELVPKHLPYDTKSAFSITVNHKDAYTGITDVDRSLAASGIGKLVDRMHKEKVDAHSYFAEHFRAPGHLHLLRASPGLLDTRKGHTELSSVLCMMAGLPPSATICEMMGDGLALSVPDAKEYAKKMGYPFLDGKEVLEAWANWSR